MNSTGGTGRSFAHVTRRASLWRAAETTRMRRLAAVALVLVGAILGATIQSEPAGAAEVNYLMPVYAADFRAENLISDANFYSGTALAESGVLLLLNNKVPACDAGGVCLADFTETTPMRPGDAMCEEYPGGSNQSASRIIAQVGAACGISQKVLLALIQKESNLVTATAPSAGMYDRATGYGCPDGTSCEPRFAGFFNQVYGAAWQFKNYLITPAERFAVGQPTEIDFSPDAALNCGSAAVTIQNTATAALYRYTPFQPNAAALTRDNFFVDGDACSSVGNRNFWAVYNGWFGSSTVDRLSGADRFSASADISAQNYSAGIDTVYVTSGVNFPDALSGAPVAAQQQAPILLVLPDAIPAAIGAELDRLQPGRIVILGGPDSVSEDVAGGLAPYARSGVQRLFGADRFSASADISRQNFGVGVPVAYVTNGYNFPDALSGAPVAAQNGAPVLLVAPGSIPESIRTELERLSPQSIVVLGGENSVSAVVAAQLDRLTGTVTRLAGPDRFSASADISLENFNADAETVYVANGLNFPDALSGAPVAGQTGAPILLVSPTNISSSVQTELDRLNPKRIVILGGINSVSQDVAQRLARSIR